MVAHSPLPWKLDVWTIENTGAYASIVAGDVEFGRIDNGDAEAMSRADAELIVRAVNSHADMLAALKAVIHNNDSILTIEVYDAVAAAIAKAEGR